MRAARPRIGLSLTLTELESREVPAVFYVVPTTTPLDSTHKYLLTDAVAAASIGDTIQIEPGTSSEAAVTIAKANLTIQGDPNVPGSILTNYDLNITTTGLTVTNLRLGEVVTSATAGNVTLKRNQIVHIVETQGTGTVGQNTISQNIITGSVKLNGNNTAAATSDVVEYNTFAGAESPQLVVTDSNNTTVRNNTFNGGGSGQTAISIQGSSGSVAILNNTISLTGGGNTTGISLDNTTSAVATHALGARIANNSINTAMAGTGISIFNYLASPMTAQIEGNDFVYNSVGVRMAVSQQLTSPGNIDLGGGANIFGTSKGGNNFRGFTGAGNHDAINMTVGTSGNELAQFNIFDVGATPGQVVADNNHNVSGGLRGTVDVSSPLSNNRAFVQSLYNRLLGRSGTLGELDGWVGQIAGQGTTAVARGILYSAESLHRIVGDYYITYLGRVSTQAERSGWVSQISNGTTLEVVQAGFLSAPEYLAHINTDFVQSLYLNTLNRTASAAELAGWNNQLGSLGLNGVALAFTRSAEHRSLVVAGYYKQLLHRAATASELSGWANGATGLLAIENTVLGSAEFFAHG